MTPIARGLVSDLVLVRMHGRSDAYLSGTPARRAAIALSCRREATVPDLAERILSRTVYAQASSRVEPLRELLQNALDASARGARIDVDLAEDGSELAVRDQGRGMTRDEVLHDLLVPFRSGKGAETEAIGEHGIGFFSALELAARVQVTTVTTGEALRLEIEPVGAGPPHRDFAWSLWTHDPGEARTTGTTVRLLPKRPLPCMRVSLDIASAARLVDPNVARIYLNDQPVNIARARMRAVSRSPVVLAGTSVGDMTIYLGRGEGVDPEWAVTQAGLLVTTRQDAFAGPELGLHRDLVRAIVAAGYGLVAELPLGVPLNKGRSAVAASAARSVDRAIAQAFERFVLEDALYDRELLRAVDHRLSTVLDRLVHAALAGELADDEATPTLRKVPAEPPAPTVAAPEDVVRFANMLVDAPAFTIVKYDGYRREARQVETLRGVLLAHRAGMLRRHGDASEGSADTSHPGLAYLAVNDPLGEALWRRLAPTARAADAAFAPPGDPALPALLPVLARTARRELMVLAGVLPGIPTLVAAMAILERIDEAISRSAGLGQSPITVHQALYGPDEMAHTDGSGISINLASHRVRVLLVALVEADVAAASAFCDLLLHEKTHVSLASFVPRATAEHGTTFYRKKDMLRRRFLEALASGDVADPIEAVAEARRSAGAVELPSPETLAAALMPARRAA